MLELYKIGGIGPYVTASDIGRMFIARRPLPLALAQSMARCKLGNTERMELLNRLYRTLSPAGQLRCKDELAQCRLAKRGGVEATIK